MKRFSSNPPSKAFDLIETTLSSQGLTKDLAGSSNASEVANRPRRLSSKPLSSFEKITSTRSIIASALPGFLTASKGEESKTPIQIVTHKAFRSIPKPSQTKKIPNQPKTKLEIIQNLKKDILELSNCASSIILCISTFKLNIDDLNTLMPGKPLSSNVIDGTLKILKNLSKIKKTGLGSIYMFPSGLSAQILLNSLFMHSKNLLKYE
jgi:hypothetical protein